MQRDNALLLDMLLYCDQAAQFASRRFFFCQVEAAETLIWLSEVPAAERATAKVLRGSWRAVTNA